MSSEKEKNQNIGHRRWTKFKQNKRAFWSLIIFSICFILSLFAELIANDKPLLIKYRDNFYVPIFSFYPEKTFGGDLKTEAIYSDIEIECLIVTGGLEECWNAPELLISDAQDSVIQNKKINKGFVIWPLIPFHYSTVDTLDVPAPSPPDKRHLLGTDDTARDVLSRVIYGFRLSVLFAIIVSILSSLIGILMGAIQGYFGGRLDLFTQRIIEIWGATPSLYVIIIVAAIYRMDFWLLIFLMTLFSWTALVGVVRAEFLRARNFEYIQAAKALGVSPIKIMFRHVLPNAMVATLTMLPFIVTGAIGSLAALDFLGFGLPSSAPSLGELTLQAKQNLQAPWLGLTAFSVFALMLMMLVFIFEGVRDAFDPRKTFS